jgi:hypothetical protein
MALNILFAQALTPEEVQALEEKLERKRARDSRRRERNQVEMQLQANRIMSARVQVAKDAMPNFGARAWLRCRFVMFQVCVICVCVLVLAPMLVYLVYARVNVCCRGLCVVCG